MARFVATGRFAGQPGIIGTLSHSAGHGASATGIQEKEGSL